MTLGQYMVQRGDLTRLLISIKLAAVLKDNDAVVEMINETFQSHLDYLEQNNKLADQFHMSIN